MIRDFEDERSFDQEIYPICRLDPMSFEDDRHFHLPLHAKIPASSIGDDDGRNVALGAALRAGSSGGTAGERRLAGLRLCVR